MTTLVDARHLALLRVLALHEVRFVLVGGVALQVRGFSGATLPENKRRAYSKGFEAQLRREAGLQAKDKQS